MNIIDDLILDRETDGRALAAPSLKVGELIARLRKADPDAPVVISGQYGGFVSVRAIDEKPLRLNVNGLEGFGPHDLPGEGETADVVALAILTEASGPE